MTELVGSYKSSDNKDYYYIALNTNNNETVLVKNAGCTAVAIDMVMKHWKIDYCLYNSSGIKMFFLGTSKEINLNRIPKKYHKCFK